MYGEDMAKYERDVKVIKITVWIFAVCMAYVVLRVGGVI